MVYGVILCKFLKPARRGVFIALGPKAHLSPLHTFPFFTDQPPSVIPSDSSDFVRFCSVDIEWGERKSIVLELVQHGST